MALPNHSIVLNQCLLELLEGHPFGKENCKQVGKKLVSPVQNKKLELFMREIRLSEEFFFIGPNR